ncbi:MAG: transglutaminase [Chitinophaga sp.]|jgi:hypothetical protein|nr:transglutaminase [Chitinophaga sp.]
MSGIFKSQSLSGMLYGLLSFAIAIVLFILSYNLLPDLEWPYKLDKFFILFVLALIIVLLVKLFKPFIFLFIIGVSMWFYYKNRDTNYDLLSFYNDTRAVFNNIQTNKNGSFVYVGYKSLLTDKQILNAIDYNEPAVRDFAVAAANKYFRKEQQLTGNDGNTWQLIQAFAVFKQIRTKWNYVSDPANEEYFAKASETVKLLAGDCDDYSIVTAACIKAIGGKCRLVCINGHIYPELFIGNKTKLKTVASLIVNQLFINESKGKQLNYHEDEAKNIWLNLDYTAYYPGGTYMGEDVIEYIYP